MAPLRSIMRYTLDKNMPTKIVVVHSARTSNDLIYREELQKLGIPLIAHDTGGSVGRTVRFDTATGKISIKTKDGMKEL